MPPHRSSGNDAHLMGASLDDAAGTSANGVKTRHKEWDLKRLRGEVSCAECRRLKLKCDKKLPCSTCTRRGCQTICPLGALLGGQGGRLVLADTDELHQTIADMSNRIRQLEDALQIEHGMRSTETHPLLKDDLLLVKKGLKRAEPETNEEDPDSENIERGEELLSAMGLLTIDKGEGIRYLGATGSEQALLAEVGVSGTMPPDAMDPELHIPEQLIQASQLWPFRTAYGSTVELHILLESQLPSRERASGLSEAFLMNTAWFSRPVTREHIMEELIPTAYKQPLDDQCTRMDLHDLALLYMIFAAGAAADLTLPPYNAEAVRYRHMALAALGLKNIFVGSSMSAVQTICLLGSYDVASGQKNSMESAWKMLCLACSMSQSIGLHRDPVRWHLDPKIVHRRRVLFWEMCWADNWKSLATGRPPSFAPETIDCEFPEDRDKIVLDDGTVIPSLSRVKYQFAKKLLSSIAVRLCAARPPKYSEILEMDRQVREFDMQVIKESPELSQKLDEDEFFVRHSSLAFFRDRVLLYIHRNYFARALSDYPSNPLQSPFSPSFLATYRSAASLLRLLRRNFSSYPHVFLRHWPTWAHALTASVVMGSIVTRSPSFSLASAAFSEIEQVINLFETASGHPIIRQGLPILTQMYERAKIALEGAKSGNATSDIAVGDVQQLINSHGEGGTKECSADFLKILMGSTRTSPDEDARSLASAPPLRDPQMTAADKITAPASSSASFAGHLTGQSMFYGAGPNAVTNPLSTSTGSMGVMPESSKAIPSRLGANGFMIHDDIPPTQSSSPLWNSLLSAGGYGDQSMLELTGRRKDMPQDRPSSSGPSHRQDSFDPMNVANAADGRPEISYFPFGGFDFSNGEHLASGSSATASSSTQGTLASQQLPPTYDMSFLPMDPDQVSVFAQASASLPEIGSPLPLIDGVSGPSGQQVDDPWQSFVSASGFQTAEELMRSWQAY